MIAPCTIADLETSPNIEALLAEYAAESAVDGLPTAYPRWEAYAALEAAGMLHVIGATLEPGLVGFITILTAPQLRYSVPLAISESFFVARTHRPSGVGLRLLCAAEDLARDLGSPGLLVSAPYGGKLFELLPRAGYLETGRSFFKKVAHA